MRNKFVADYIFEKTQVRRTPKQVGSRIQQLRDTNSGKQSEHRDLLRLGGDDALLTSYAQSSRSSPIAITK